MADIFEQSGGQDIARQQIVPVLFRWLEVAGIGDASAPGQWSPLLAGPTGALYVESVGGAALTPLETLDLTNADYTPVAGDIGRIGVSLTWAWDDDNSEYSRVYKTRETVGIDGSALQALNTAAAKHRYTPSEGFWNPEESNDTETILASAARTTDTTSAEFINYNHNAIHVIVDVTAIVDTPSIVVNIEAQDVVSGVWYPLLIAAAITTTGTTVLKVGPGFTPVASLTANDRLPYKWRVRVEHADADSITYSVGGNKFIG